VASKQAITEARMTASKQGVLYANMQASIETDYSLSSRGLQR
jgi:hypothetical protein